MLEKEKELLKIKPEYYGLSSLNPDADCDSSSRGAMAGSMLAQSLVLTNGTPRRIQTYMDHALKQSTFSVKIENDCTVIKIIPRYKQTLGIDSITHNPETTIIYEDCETMELGYINIPTYHKVHQHLGFIYVHGDICSELHSGMFLRKGTILADSPAVTPEGDYNYGVELNMVCMSHHATSDDGIWVSESTLEKLAFDVIETRTFEFGTKSLPLNIYGDEDIYKIIPDIGEKIKDTGLLCATRKINTLLNPVYLNHEFSSSVDHLFDDPVYSFNGDGTVIDILIQHSPRDNSNVPDRISKGLNKYISGSMEYYEDLIRFENSQRRDRKAKFNSDDINLTPPLHRLLVEAYGMTNNKNASNSWISRTFKKNPIDEYRVTVVIKHRVIPNLGYKLSGQHGDKVTITYITPDDYMPVDELGTRSDVVCEDVSTISRMNPGRAYEPFNSDTIVKVGKDIREKLGYDRHGKTVDDIEELVDKIDDISDKEMSYIAGDILDLLKIMSPKQHAHHSKLSISDWREYLFDIIANDGLRLFVELGDVEDKVQTIVDIQNSKFKPHLGKLTYRDINGNPVTTMENIFIAPYHFILLDKIADTWLSVASAKLQVLGLPSAPSKSEKHSRPWKMAPTRCGSETDMRIITSNTPPIATAEIMDRSNNPRTHREEYKSILTANKPGRIKCSVDRNKIKYGGTMPLQYFKHILLCRGITLKYDKDNK